MGWVGGIVWVDGWGWGVGFTRGGVERVLGWVGDKGWWGDKIIEFSVVVGDK